MKFITRLAAALFLFAACTPKNSQAPSEPVNTVSEKVTKNKAAPPAEVPAMNEPDLIKGIKLQFAKSEKNASFYKVSDVKIIEDKTGRVIDEFPERIWGPVSIQTRNETVTWLRFSEEGSELSVAYSANEKGDVTKRATCHMYKDPKAHDQYSAALSKLDDKSVDGDKGVSQLRRLAEHGSKDAYEFFMAPNAQQKKYQKLNDDAASFNSAREVLKFMKAAGCDWSKGTKVEIKS